MTKTVNFVQLGENGMVKEGATSKVGPHLRLSELDRLPLRVLGKSQETLEEHVRSLAEALTGDDADGVRARLLGKAIATERAHQSVVQGLLANRLAAKDSRGADQLTRVLNGVTTRLATLLREHRLNNMHGQRPLLVVGHADNVNVSAGQR